MRLSVLLIVVSLGLAGCASKSPVVETVPTQIPLAESEPDLCVGQPADTQAWCDAFGVVCECSTEQVSLFNEARNLDLVPSDVAGWVAALPEDYSPSRVLAWATSGVPLDVSPGWIAGGYGADVAGNLYRSGLTPLDVKMYQDAGVSPAAAAQWKSALIPPELAKLWVQEGVSPQVAEKATKVFGLVDHALVSRYLLEQRFKPLEVGGFHSPRTLVCSKTNRIAELVSVNNLQIDAVSRYRLINSKGFPLPALSLFRKGIDESQVRMVRDVRRIRDTVNNWSLCPIGVANRVGL